MYETKYIGTGIIALATRIGANKIVGDALVAKVLPYVKFKSKLEIVPVAFGVAGLAGAAAEVATDYVGKTIDDGIDAAKDLFKFVKGALTNKEPEPEEENYDDEDIVVAERETEIGDKTITEMPTGMENTVNVVMDMETLHGFKEYLQTLAEQNATVVKEAKDESKTDTVV